METHHASSFFLIDKAAPEGSTSPPKPAFLRRMQSLGFDTCSAPEPETLKAWWDDPGMPYRFVNMYFGGSNRGCKDWNQRMITSDWVRRVATIGWTLLPTWVGLQAQNFYNPETRRYTDFNLMSNDPSKTEQQGRDEAAEAARAAKDIGLPAGEILYVDIEGPYDPDPTIRERVKNYVNGWVSELHSRGYLAGAYGHANGGAPGISNVGDWASIPYPPDAVWAVKIFHSKNCDSVFGLDPLKNELWNDHQRIRQCEHELADHNSYGVTRPWTLRIDKNLADGPLATVGGGGSGHLRGRIFVDSNSNQQWDPGEALIGTGACPTGRTVAGFQVTWSGASSGSTTPSLCNPDPYYDSGAIPAGSYAVQVTTPSGWEAIGANPVTVTVDANGIHHRWFAVRESGGTAPFGVLDAPSANASVTGTVSVAGWVVDQEDATLTVELLVDNQRVSSSPTRGARPDVCNAFPAITHCASSQPGFTFTWNTATVTNGAHTLAIRVTDGGGLSATLGPRTVTVSGTPPSYLPAPTLFIPGNGATGQSTTPTFTWSAVTGADLGYRILVATDPAVLTSDPTVSTCGGCVINATPGGTSYTPAAGVLSAGTTYFWKVHGRSTTTVGNWSGAWSFTTATVAPTSCTEAEPNDFSSQANSLTLNVGCSGKISTSTDKDWFDIYVNSGTTITFYLRVPSGLNYDMALYGPTNTNSSQHWLVNGNANYAGQPESITYTTTTSGYFAVQIYGYQGAYSPTSTYTITRTQ